MNKQYLFFLMLISLFTTSRAQIGINDTIVPVKIILDTIPDFPQTRSTGSDYTGKLVTSKNFSPSPEAHSLMQYSDIPVSLYTGVPNISIPIYTIEVGDYRLPITLQYHASGIKVAQEASRVGLGWSLHAGGAVGRIIQNRDDFDGYGFYMCADTVPQYYSSNILNQDNIGNEELDLESDIYHYNFADYSGKFVVRKGEYEDNNLERYFLLKPEDNLRIKGCEDYFRIITEDNIQYVFDRIEMRTMCSITFEDEWEGIYYDISSKPNRTFIPPDESSYFHRPYTKTNWLLSKIILPNGYEISFDYDIITNSYLSPVNESYTEYLLLESQYFPGFEATQPISEYKPKNKRNISLELTKEEYILKKIRWNSGYMEFRKSDTARKDITGYDPSAGSTSLKRIHSENTALEYIEVYSDTNDIPVISYKLHHSYFFGKKEYNGSVIIDTTYLSARLKLDSITIQSKGAVQKYKMEYDMSDNFPLKNEYYTDKWGYYTDNNPLKIPYYHYTMENNWYVFDREENCRNIGCIYLDPKRILVTKGREFYYKDGYESTSSEAGKTWMLTKLTSPMGAETCFEYECNTVYTEKVDVTYTDVLNLPSITISNVNDTLIKVPLVGKDNSAYKLRLECIETKNSSSTTKGMTVRTLPLSINSQGYPQNTEVTQSNGYITRVFTLEGNIPEQFQLDTLNLYLSSAGDADIRINASLHKTVTSPAKERVGGVRISRISSPVSRTRYVYKENNNCTGLLLRKPSFSYPKCHFYILEFAALYGVFAIHYTIEFNSSPLRTPFNPYNGYHMGYSVVYTIKEDGDQELVERYQFFNRPETDYYYTSDQGTHNPLNGKLENHKILKEGRVVKETKYKYDTISVNKVRCLKIGEALNERCYYATSYFTYLDSIATIDYNNCKSTKYVYDNEIYKPRYVTTYSTGLPTSKVEYYYSKDYPSYLGGKFRNANLNTVKLMEKHYNDHYLTKTVVNTHHHDVLVKPYKEYLFYDINGDNANPLTLSASDSTKPDVTYCNYTAMGRPTELMSRGGQRVVLLWSYKNQYLIAQINNATLQDVVNCGINIDELANKVEPDSDDWDKIHKLRSDLPGASVVVSKYEPLVGMISQTDARGIETRYTYDSFNRLHQVIEVRDNEEYILKQYEYTYATEE